MSRARALYDKQSGDFKITFITAGETVNIISETSLSPGLPFWVSYKLIKNKAIFADVIAREKTIKYRSGKL